jgi:hypothetical protein
MTKPEQSRFTADIENDELRLMAEADMVMRKKNTHNSAAASMTGKSFFARSATRLSFSSS